MFWINAVPLCISNFSESSCLAYHPNFSKLKCRKLLKFRFLNRFQWQSLIEFWKNQYKGPKRSIQELPALDFLTIRRLTHVHRGDSAHFCHLLIPQIPPILFLKSTFQVEAGLKWAVQLKKPRVQLFQIYQSFWNFNIFPSLNWTYAFLSLWCHLIIRKMLITGFNRCLENLYWTPESNFISSVLFVTFFPSFQAPST